MAVHDLLEKLGKADAQNDNHEAVELAAFLETSSCRIPDIYYIKAFHLKALGYHHDAVKSLQHGLQLFPEDQKIIELLRLIGQRPDNVISRSYDASDKNLEIPAWLALADASFLLFPDTIDQELFFTIQRILYDDLLLTTCLDIGASNGDGSTRAMVEATTGRSGTRIFSIEPEPEKFRILASKYAGNVQAYQGLSVSFEDYMPETELSCFYQETQSIYNFYPYSYIAEKYATELSCIRDMATQDKVIQKIKIDEQIRVFDLVVMDGSLFTGKADLAAVYGAKYIVLNYVLSTKNYDNLGLLLRDQNYKVATANLKNRCGYVVFERISSCITN
jgi:hypothetical protein